MEAKDPNLSVTLGGNKLESGVSDRPRILQILPPEIQDLKTDYVVLGEEENAFVALPKELTARATETVEDASVKVHSEQQRFLLIVNDSGLAQYKTLVFEISKLDENITLGDISAFEEFKTLITERNCESSKKCLFDDKSRVLTYGPYIIHSDTAIKQDGISFKERRPKYLQDSTPEEINRLIALNKKAQEVTPSAA